MNIRTLNCKMWTTMLSQERGNTYHTLFSFFTNATETSSIMEEKLILEAINHGKD